MITRQAENRVLLSNVAWSTFESLLAENESRGTRFTYDRGYLEIMSPSREHELVKTLLGRMVELMAVELNIPISSGGSTTLKEEFKQRGLEPDECYYVANEPAMRGRDEYDAAVDPPPDLVIEVDISRGSLDKLPIYADFGVPEVWLFEDTTLRILTLAADGAYHPQEQSLSLPLLRRADIQRFLDQRSAMNETAWSRAFRDWVRGLAGGQ